MDHSFLTAADVPFASRPRAIRLLLLILFLFVSSLWLSSRGLNSANFLPHWYCLAGNTRLLWTTVLGDLFIGLSYLAISATLVRILRQSGTDLPYQGFFLAFGLFILSCGITHFLEIVTLWHPVYWLAAAAKILTAVSSAGTAIVLAIAASDIVAFVHATRLLTSAHGNQRFRAVFLAAPQSIVTYDSDCHVTSWNPSAEKTFGFPEIEVLGRPSPNVPPELFSEHIRLLKKTFQGKITTDLQTMGKRRDGSQIPMNVSTAPLYDAGKKLIGVMATFEDISERQRAESELRDRTNNLLTVTHALNIYLDTGDWKAAGGELLNFAMQQTASEQGFLAVVLDDSRLRVLAHDQATWDLNLQLAPTHLEDQQQHGESQNQSQSLRDLFRQVISFGHTVISNDLICEPQSGGMPPDHPPLESFLGVPIYKGNEVAGLMAVANRAAGYSGSEWRSLETMSRATGILYDHYRQTLKRTELEEKQSVLEAHLRQSQNLDLLARVAGGFAHDFNNLLMILSGASELLDRSLGADSLSRIYVDQIQRSTAKAAATTRQLLAFSRKQVLNIQPMDVHSALLECECMLLHAMNSSIELHFSSAAGRSWIRSDLPQIVQVIMNLAGNSADAMPNGGQLIVSTRNVDLPPVLVPPSLADFNDWLLLEVRDTGYGMDQTTLAQIFDPFFSTKPVGRGTGLGLSTVYGVVRQSGGLINVSSEPGVGTCFEIYFPAIAAPQLSALPAATPAGHALPEIATVLLVDDEAALVHAIGEFLRECGYIVLDAFSSQDALDLAKEHPGKIDVLITDVVMPGLRGPELHRQITELQPNIQVLFMSGYAEGLPEMKLPDGALFLQKPFRFAALLDSLRQLHIRN
jgi:PAS domain S-box-containing protein